MLVRVFLKMNYFLFTVLVLDLTGEALWYARLLCVGEWMPLLVEQYAHH
jgi:hypothetical protein